MRPCHVLRPVLPPCWTPPMRQIFTRGLSTLAHPRRGCQTVINPSRAPHRQQTGHAMSVRAASCQCCGCCSRFLSRTPVMATRGITFGRQREPSVPTSSSSVISASHMKDKREKSKDVESVGDVRVERARKNSKRNANAKTKKRKGGKKVNSKVEHTGEREAGKSSAHQPPVTDTPASFSPFLALRLALSAASASAASSTDPVIRDEHGQRYTLRTQSSSVRTICADEPSVCAAVEQWLHPAVLQRRVRALLVQLLLLSPHPHTSETLIESTLANCLDTTTQYMATWVAYAMRIYEAYEEGVMAHGACGVEARESTCEPEMRWADSRDKDELAVMQRVGREWVAMESFSVLHIASSPLTACTRLHATRQRQGSPVSHAWRHVIRTLALSILLSDPYFCVAARSGHVCYPALPSKMLFTWNLDAFECPRAWLPSSRTASVWASPAAQLSSSLPAHSRTPDERIGTDEDRTEKRRSSCVSVATALGAWARHAPHVAVRTAETATKLSAEAAVVYLCDDTPFLWLSQVSQKAPAATSASTHARPTWTFMQSLWHAFEAMRADTSLDTTAHAPARAELTDGAQPQDAQESHCVRTSGSALVDAWILYLDANKASSVGCFVGVEEALEGEGDEAETCGRLLGHQRTSLWQRGSAETRRREPKQNTQNKPDIATTALVGWDEARYGAMTLQDWVRESAGSPQSATGFAEDTLATSPLSPPSTSDVALSSPQGTGSLVSLVANAMQVSGHQSAHRYRLHARANFNVFSQLVAVPITVTRLAMLLRWNARVSFTASFDNSCLNYLLEAACNPHTDALGRRERTHRRAREHIAPVLRQLSHDRFTSHLAHVVNTLARHMEADATMEDSEEGTLPRHAPARFRSQSASSPPQGPAHTKETAASSHLTTMTRNWRTIHPHLTSMRSAPPLMVQLVLFRCWAWPPSTETKENRKRRRSESESATQHASDNRIACRHFRGHPLRFVERIRTEDFTAQEIHAYLEAQAKDCGVECDADADAPTSSSSSSSSSAELPHLIKEEGRILCMPASERILMRRFSHLVREFQSAQTRETGPADPRRRHRTSRQVMAPITVGTLAELSLWALEYPLPMASEMLVLYLGLFEERVRLTAPPAAPSRGVSCDPDARGDSKEGSFSEWLVHFV